MEMSTTSALEGNEDLENIPLVRMADVQPDRTSDMYLKGIKTTVVNVYEDFIDCKEEDNYSIGSMISIKSEEVESVEDSNEKTVPEILETNEISMTDIVEKPVKQNPESWPTLEILPGGVIKHAISMQQFENNIANIYESETEVEDDRMYACAKCPQKFNFLFCLVKHVKWHENQKKKEKLMRHIGEVPEKKKRAKKNVSSKRKYINVISNKKKVISILKSKCKVPKK